MLIIVHIHRNFHCACRQTINKRRSITLKETFSFIEFVCKLWIEVEILKSPSVPLGCEVNLFRHLEIVL